MNKKQIIEELDAGRFEQTEEGVLFPRTGMLARGEYRHWVNGKDERVDHNIVTDEGIRHVLDVTFHGTAIVPTWYLSLYAANYTPLPSLTAATYPATANEIVSGTEGYSEATRVVFNEAAAAANSTTNTASKAAFTIATASSLAVNGAALSSVAAKGATTGVLVSATKFSATRTLFNADVFTLAYTVTLTSA